MEVSKKGKRVISIFMLAMLNVSIMASLRSLPLVASYGLSALFYFVLVAIFFLLPCALVSAELSTGWPKAGGVYIWIREGLGERWGFLAIWMQWIHSVPWYPVILSFVASTVAYVIDPKLVDNKIFVFTVILVSFWGMTLLNYLGIRTSTWFSTVGVILGTIAPGILIIGLGIAWLTSGKPIQTPLNLPALIPDFSQFGNLVFLAGLFLAFAGLEVSASHARDVKDPQKNYPRAIVLAAIITFSVFMLGSLAIAFVIPQHEISLVSGLMEAFKKFFDVYNLGWILPIIGVALIIGAAAEVNAWIIGPVRALFATSQYGHLPPFFQKLNRHGMPINILFFQALIVTIAALVFLYLPTVSASFWILSAMAAQSYLIMYILMFIAAIRLRYTRPKVPRPYRIPHKNKGIWIVSCLGILSSSFAIAIGFYPPSQLNVGSLFFYDGFLIAGLIFMIALPLIIHQFRKPSWVRKE